MGKYAVTLLMSLTFSGFSVSQPIVAIGDIKIGMSEDEFLEVPEIKAKTLKDKSNQTSAENLEILRGKGFTKLWKTTKDSNVASYNRIYTTQVTNFEFAMPLGISNSQGDTYGIALNFFDGRLIEIRVDQAGVNFEKALEVKYGPAIMEDKTKSVTCQNGYGAKSEHLIGSLASIWGKDKPIEAKVYWTFFDCGERGSAYYIRDVKKVQQANELEKSAKKEATNADIKAKASSSRL